ncbi:hypothetical protein AWN76_004555 [Rhodothermaceae bacterium RA]|nr:hypothetical protein AWN76_004555 [Rhodothermaceae bacterium RA]
MESRPTHTFDTLTVTIDRALCIGSGNCVNLAPGVFRLDEQSLVTFTDAPEPDALATLVEACAVCPVGALIVTDEDGRQIVP